MRLWVSKFQSIGRLKKGIEMTDDKYEINEAIRLLKENDYPFDKVVSLLQEVVSETLESECQFYKDQPVLVSDEGIEWIRGYFSHQDGERFAVFAGRATSYSVPCSDPYLAFFDYVYCKPDPDAKSLLNWIEWNGGVCPLIENTCVALQFRDGRIKAGPVWPRMWRNKGLESDIIRYAVIEAPEFFLPTNF